MKLSGVGFSGVIFYEGKTLFVHEACVSTASIKLSNMVVHLKCIGEGRKIREERQCQNQGCISCGMCSYPELTKDHVLTSAYVNIFRTVTRNAVNKSV